MWHKLSFMTRAAVGTGLAVVGAASLFRYLELSLGGGAGLPLDDSWIHLQFARNIAAGQGFAFNPGEATSGSTAPLWTLSLAALMLLPWEILDSIKVVGLLFHWASCLFAVRLARHHGLEPGWSFLVGLVVAITPRLVWGALSGMEIPLYLMLATAGLCLHVESIKRSPSILGTSLLALAVLARPECLILFPLSLVDRWRANPLGTHLRANLTHGLIYVGIIAPAIVFNLHTSGRPLPNTFYAKVGSYGLLHAVATFDLLQIVKTVVVYPLFQARELVQFAVENNLILGLVFLWGCVELLRHKRDNLSSWIIPLSLIAFPLLRGALAPFKGALFQHGRYAAFLVPLIAVAGVIGLRGLLEIATSGRPYDQVRRIRQLTVPAVIALLMADLCIANLQYARIYALNVRNINSTHVKMGRWLADNTPVEAVIATHDIGAVGYFSNRRILDTTGLVTPAVLTYLQPKRPADEGVARFLRVAKPDYLVLIPSWYPALIAKIGAVQPVFEIDVANNTVVAGDRFVAYRTPWSRRVPSPP